METYFKLVRLKPILGTITAIAVVVATMLPGIVFASFNPTLLVNTESFLRVEPGDGTTNIELQFGSSERLDFDITDGRFEFTDDLEVQGNLAVTGNTALTGTLTVTGATALSTLNTSGLATLNSATVTNNATVGGTLGVTGAVTITGATTINSTLLTTGDISTNNSVVLNADGTADTATLTFGGSSAETLAFNSSQFVFSDDLQVQGNLAVTGTAAVTGAATFGSTVGITGNTTVGGTLGVTGAVTVTGATTLNSGVTVVGTATGTSLAVTSGNVRINNVQYTFTGSQGAAGTVLTNDGSGNLSWAASAISNGSGSFVSLHPQFPNTTVKADGTSNVGTLALDVISGNNYYVWTTTRATAQDYDLYTRLQVPANFASWAVNGVQVERNNSGTGSVRVDLIDTTGATQAGTPQTGVGVQSITPSGTYAPGGYMTVKITVSATNTGPARVGKLDLRWLTTTP